MKNMLSAYHHSESTLASANPQRISSGLMMTSTKCTLSSHRKLKHKE